MEKTKDEGPGWEDLANLGEKIGGVVVEGAKPIAEAVGRVGTALAMESKDPRPNQNALLAEPGAGDQQVSQKEFVAHGGAKVEAIRQLYTQRAAENAVEIVKGLHDWKKTVIENHQG
jgi:hypothetical protein